MGEPSEEDDIAERGVLGRATHEGQRAIDEEHQGLEQALDKRPPRSRRKAFSDVRQAQADSAAAAGRVEAYIAAQRAARMKHGAIPQVVVHGGGFEQIALESSVPTGFPVGADHDGTIPAFAAPSIPVMTPPGGLASMPPRPNGTPKQAAPATSVSSTTNWAQAWLQMHGPNVAPPVQDRRQWESANLGAARARVDWATIGSALTVARHTTYQQLREAGLHSPAAKNGRVVDLVGGIIYVGPGFAVAVDTQGQLANIPLVGWSFRVRGLTDGRPSPWGVFLAFASEYVKVTASLQQGDPYPATNGQYGLTTDGLRGDEERALRRWSAGSPGNGHGVLIVASRSYKRRLGNLAAVRGGPGRLMDAISRCVVEGYLEKAMEKAIDDLSMWEIAKEAFVKIVKRVFPVPFADEIDDNRRIAMAVGMAIWGTGNNRGDIDAAARMLAPEIAGMAIGSGVSVGLKGAFKGGAATATLLRDKPSVPDISSSLPVAIPRQESTANSPIAPSVDPADARSTHATTAPATHASDLVWPNERGIDGRAVPTSATPAAAHARRDPLSGSAGPSGPGGRARIGHQRGLGGVGVRTPTGTRSPKEITPDSMVFDLLLAPRNQLDAAQLKNLARLEGMGIRRPEDGSAPDLVILPDTWAETQDAGKVVGLVDSSMIRTKTIDVAPKDRRLGRGERGTVLGELQHMADKARRDSPTGDKLVLEYKDDILVRQALHVQNRNGGSRIFVTADKLLITRLSQFARSTDLRGLRYGDLVETLRTKGHDGFEVDIAGHTMVLVPL